MLENETNEFAEFTAPPSGLFLEQILYEKEKWNEALAPAIPLTMRR
jgi:hypothetical protein